MLRRDREVRGWVGMKPVEETRPIGWLSSKYKGCGGRERRGTCYGIVKSCLTVGFGGSSPLVFLRGYTSIAAAEAGHQAIVSQELCCNRASVISTYVNVALSPLKLLSISGSSFFVITPLPYLGRLCVYLFQVNALR